MTHEPTLVIMAAGMGSRFGGLKQMEPVDKEGHSIIDFSMYDARRAGFRDLVFIIKREHDALFRERIGNRMEQHVCIRVPQQSLFIGNLYTAQNQLSVFHKAVHVIAVPDPKR